jgi:outer membrane biosynthesis protein TonB
LPSDAKSGSGGKPVMIKPSLVQQPPALPKQPKENNAKSITLSVKNTKSEKTPPKQIANLNSNIIPTTVPEAGNGGIPGNRSGSGGGSGGGNGVFIGPGSGGVGDDWYSRQVAARISQNWMRPLDGTHVEMVYSFYISANGTLYNITKEKSSGNPAMDLTAYQALSASYNPDPLPSPPLNIRTVKFIARFIYPSNP